MKIICVGYAKTGTKSMAKALRHLGFSVFDWEEQVFDFLARALLCCDIKLHVIMFIHSVSR